ncbi:MAG: hypothetical protein G01um101491_96 [Parcubacteria group bacterium Gr01-1014_91]|nr:MAG: hypothetical protein G01um101491_96 [Parcubacteria group bacterium Gr01-1014_91]
MEKITPRGFAEHVRSSLVSGHNFDTDGANHAQNAYNSYLVESGHSELKREHLPDALTHIQAHPDFKKLSSRQQEAFLSTLHKTLDVTNEATPE